jgi:hypothetical protein
MQTHKSFVRTQMRRNKILEKKNFHRKPRIENQNHKINAAQTEGIKPNKLSGAVPSPTPGLVCKETNRSGQQKQPNNQPNTHLQDTLMYWRWLPDS